MQRNDPNRDLNPFIAGVGYEIYKYHNPNAGQCDSFHVKHVSLRSCNIVDSATFPCRAGEENEAIEKCKNWLRERGVRC
jgi:hypothetical protein